MARLSAPEEHRGTLIDPPYETWAGLLSRNVRAAGSWRFEVAGLPAAGLRRAARRDAVRRAAAFSARMGVPVDMPPEECPAVVMAGHQPELFHPGVWAKMLLLQRISDDTGAVGLDLVVDTDGFDSLETHVPCVGDEGLMRCRSVLAVGREGGCYGCTALPSREELSAFVERLRSALATLEAPAVREAFEGFARHLDEAWGPARNIAELLTFARRRHEADAGTRYLELPVSSQAGGEAFLTFLADIAYRAEEFVAVYDEELISFRKRTGSRSSAQPFPDLGSEGGLLELPFWSLAGGGRESVWVRPGPEPELVTAESRVRLPREPRDAASILAAGPAFAPKALSLTMFNRMFASDLLIHGTGGARYDEVTDEIVRRFYGVEPPGYVTVTLTAHLPLEGPEVSAEDIARGEERLNRLEHNPDQLLDEAGLSHEEEERARRLARRKRELVEAIKAPGADKKALGGEIRDVNSELAAMMSPLRSRLEDRVEELARAAERTAVLKDRTYPFFLWGPSEISGMLP